MDFVQVEAEFERLKAQFEEGALSEEEFKTQLQDLMIEDEQGRWWILGYETGQWYVHDGEQWIQQEPPLPEDLRPVPPDVGKSDQPLHDTPDELRKKLRVPSDRLLIASFSVPIITFLLNLAAVDGLYGKYCNYYYVRCPDPVHLLCAAAMPALLPGALLLFKFSPGIVARSLVFVGVVISLYWIGAPIILVLSGGLSGPAEEIYTPSIVVLVASAILSPIYGKIAHDRAKRQASRAGE
jgi:TM2 domain-containing membrane protein YozV